MKPICSSLRLFALLLSMLMLFAACTPAANGGDESTGGESVTETEKTTEPTTDPSTDTDAATDPAEESDPAEDTLESTETDGETDANTEEESAPASIGETTEETETPSAEETAEETTEETDPVEDETYIRVDADGNRSENGGYVLFGSYPQSEVKDETLTRTLGDLAGTLPTDEVAGNWTSYEYYIQNSNETAFMWYQDVTAGGNRYRGVYFAEYRPCSTDRPATVDDSYQDNNGYQTGTVYWFEYEPIKWRILTEKDGGAMLLCEMLIDGQDFHYTQTPPTEEGDTETVYANNYEYSHIRAWLNSTFYDTAFCDYEKAIIQKTVVDNSAATTETLTNEYACNNTEDFVFLPSFSEVGNKEFGFSGNPTSEDSTLQKKTTAYARCQGVMAYQAGTFIGGATWYLRTPSEHGGKLAVLVGAGGAASQSSGVTGTSYGICPALWITL